MELLIVAPGETAENIARRIRLARLLGHREILLLTTPTKQPPSPVPGATWAALVRNQQEARRHRAAYTHLIAPCERELIECKEVDYLLEPERQERSDFIHHRNSGLNQVLLALCTGNAKRKPKGIITTTSLLLNGRRPETTLGRMMQNAWWTKKYGVPYHLVSGARTLWEQRGANDLAALRRELLNG